MKSKIYLSKTKYKIIFTCIILINMVSVDGSAKAEIMPAARQVKWQGNVGVEGGIPFRKNTRNCMVSDGAVGDGEADDTTPLRNCITNTSVGNVAYLPPRTVSCYQTITINKGITLRGAGRDLTVIESGAPQLYSYYRGQYQNGTAANIESGYVKVPHR